MIPLSFSKNQRHSGGTMVVLALACATLLVAGCAAPIGADMVTTRQSYDQVDANALRTGQPGAKTVEVLHRFNMDDLAAGHPDEAVRRLHQKALESGDRNLLFALAEMSFVAGEHIRHSVKPWDDRDARDYYLGSAVYAYLYLIGEAGLGPSGVFHRRFREACDFYNYSLGLALTEPKGTNAVVRLESSRRRLPVGSIELRLADTPLAGQLNTYEKLLLADRFRVRGLSVRNREAGMGTPLICVEAVEGPLGLRRAMAASVFLRLPGSLSEVAAGTNAGSLELYSMDTRTVAIGGTEVPLEIDLTTPRAYLLNQSTVWALGPLQFLAPAERIPSQLILNQPYDPTRIPVVMVHGTFSSPVTWAEMANTLAGDPVLRKRYQVWSFIYGSGNPLLQSITEFRNALTAEVKRWDPAGTNALLRQMVIIGHSQGGLLTKASAIDSGDKIWRTVSTNRLEDLKISEDLRADLRRMIFLEPLPYVRRVVFIATPHRGSYRLGGFLRRLGQRLVSLPGNLMARGSDLVKVTRGSAAGRFMEGKVPTSLDGMSPRNPSTLAMAEIPVAPGVTAHSIIAVDGDGDYHTGKDGIVSYQSAHQEYVASEYIVRSYHTCLDHPDTIEEIRRILYEHLAHVPGGTTAADSQPIRSINQQDPAFLAH